MSLKFFVLGRRGILVRVGQAFVSVVDHVGDCWQPLIKGKEENNTFILGVGDLFQEGFTSAEQENVVFTLW